MNKSLIVLSAVALLVVGSLDYEDELARQKHYCDMVAIWNEQAKAGVPKYERSGWPPFDGEEICEKAR